MWMADDNRITPVAVLAKHQLDIASYTGFPVQPVAQCVCDIIHSHTRFQFLEVYLVIRHKQSDLL